MNCLKCGSDKIQKRGFNRSQAGDFQRYFCTECRAWFSESTGEIEEYSNAPKILIFDIETNIKTAYLFRSGKQYVNADNFIDRNSMICWSAKILGDNKVFGDCLTPEEVKSRNYTRVVKSLWNAMYDVDFTITHNGLNFDLPMINTFFLEERLGLPNKHRNIDTCNILRRNFRLDSNRLDFAVRYFGLNSGKSETDMKLWLDCYAGDKTALQKMFEYNKNDVVILEDLFNYLRPYIPNFSNLGVWGDTDEKQCPYCRSTNFSPKGYMYTPNGKYNSFVCECKAIFRSRTNLLSKEKRDAQFAVK